MPTAIHGQCVALSCAHRRNRPPMLGADNGADAERDRERDLRLQRIPKICYHALERVRGCILDSLQVPTHQFVIQLVDAHQIPPSCKISCSLVAASSYALLAAKCFFQGGLSCITCSALSSDSSDCWMR